MNLLLLSSSGAGIFCDDDGSRFSLYADSIYSTSDHLIAAVRGNHVPEHHLAFNHLASALRVSVEWSIGKIYHVCRLLHTPSMNCVFRDSLTKRFAVAVFLTNCHTTLYGSQVANYFGCQMPTLSQYTDPLFRKE